MPTTLVLGAGASLASALHFHPVRNTRMNPPLDYNFFDKIAALGITVPAELRHWAASEAAVDPFAGGGGPPVRMEEFFKELFGEFQDAASATGPATKAYTQMVEIYAQVLRQTTNWMCADSRKGAPLGRLIQQLAENDDDLSVITFNHDLVIENEIFKRARLRKRWCLDQGYGTYVAGLPVTAPTGRGFAKFPGHDATCDHTRPITVYKLHGSLNWYVKMRGQTPARGLLSGSSASTKIEVTRRRTLAAQITVTNRKTSTGRGGRTRWSTWPVVVPPVHEKDAIIRATIQPVWDEARSALARADTLVFCGYSLPMLDTGAERLFQRALNSSPSVPWVNVIDPSPGVTTRYAALAPRMPLRWYPSIATYLDGTA
jgi:hypothetical protein